MPQVKWQVTAPERLLSTLRDWPRQSGDAHAVVIGKGFGRDLRSGIDLLDEIRGDLRLPWPIVLITFEPLERYSQFAESFSGDPSRPSPGLITLPGEKLSYARLLC